MFNILALETTGKFCSVALFSNEQILDEIISEELNSSSSILHQQISNLLQLGSLNISEIHAISISSGPGSYTGLRVGSSTAKGLCMALDIPLIAIPTHEIMTYHTAIKVKNVLCITEARREDVFVSEYEQNRLIRPVKVLDINTPEFETLVTRNHLIGSGVPKVIKRYKGIEYINEDGLKARFQLIPALKRVKERAFEDIYQFERAYEKAFYTTQKTT